MNNEIAKYAAEMADAISQAVANNNKSAELDTPSMSASADALITASIQ